MRVLVTGSNGFIGRHVCKFLFGRGYEIIGLGRHKESLTDYVHEYYTCDLNNDDIFRIFAGTEQRLDAVIHLAADMRHEPYNIQVIESNCAGTQRLLELCKRKDIDIFLQLSSLPLIGKPKQFPIKENHFVDPPTIYHATKRMQELLANYADEYCGIRTASFRIPAPVGIGMNVKTILPVLIRKSLKNEDIELIGKGTRKQTYIHVDDISQALELALLTDCHGVYNLASNNLYSNKSLAELCVKILKSNSKIKFTNINDPMDDYIWKVSIDKLIKDTGFMPQVTMKMIIRELADYYGKKENEKTIFCHTLL